VKDFFSIKNAFMIPENVKNIKKEGTHDKIWKNTERSDLKNLKLRTNVSDEILD